MTRIVARAVLRARLDEEDAACHGGPGELVAEVVLNKLDGVPRPNFAVTSTVVVKGAIVAHGQHIRMLEYFPELAALLACHLHLDDGRPMHGDGPRLPEAVLDEATATLAYLAGKRREAA